jgi:NTP pyrophosphatase (non-canonical NTP hydrolase)
MNIKKYEELSARTMSPYYHPHAVKPETAHGIVGLAGEAGELLGAMKKALFYGKPFDLVNLREEIGDVMWYLMTIVRSEGWGLEEILKENIEKLKLRYPEQFTTELSEERLDKKK